MTAAKRYRLAQQRKAMGFSQERLAECLEVDRSTIVRWESGGTEPQPWVRPKLSETLGVSLDQLTTLLEITYARVSLPAVTVAASGTPDDDLEADREGPSELDDRNRRELLRLMSMAGTLVAMSGIEDGLDWERLDYFADSTRQLDPAAIEEYSALNAHLWRVFALSKTKRHTYPLVREQLGVLVNALQRSHGGAAHRELCALVADLFQTCRRDLVRRQSLHGSRALLHPGDHRQQGSGRIRHVGVRADPSRIHRRVRAAVPKACAKRPATGCE
ncbi:MAG TPA: helix-turn-helix transcriptional regulator [Pseudonocardiaceae bacterium]